MSKFVEASCQANVVTANGFSVSAEILSQGTKASTGLLFMQADKMKYVTSNATDIADTISKLGEILSSMQTILSALDGVTTAPGASATAIAALSTKLTQLSTIGSNLK